MCLYSELKSLINKIFPNTVIYINDDCAQVQNKNDYQHFREVFIK